MNRIALICVLPIFLFCGLANAAPISVTNASFDDNVLSTDWADGIPNGWETDLAVGTPDPLTVDSNNLLFHEKSGAIGASGGDGTNYLGLRPNAVVFQDLGVAIQPSTTYTMDALLNRRGAAVTTGSFFFADSNGNTLGTAGTWNTDGMSSDVFTAISTLPAANGTAASYTSGASVPAGNLRIYLTGTAGNSVVDLVSVDAVPEPAGLAALLFMALGSFWMVRRRTHA